MVTCGTLSQRASSFPFSLSYFLEITNFFFNGQYLLADLGYQQFTMPMQLAFVAVFFGYRMGFLLPV
jgi:hypothetical protein